MKKNNLLKAGLLLAIIFLILSVSAESVKAAVTISSITGGIGVTATIQNTGTTDVTNVGWTITTTGGWIFSNQIKTGTIAVISPGDAVTIQSRPIGFGTFSSFFNNVIFTVTATGATSVSTPPGPTHLFFILTW